MEIIEKKVKDSEITLLLKGDFTINQVREVKAKLSDFYKKYQKINFDLSKIRKFDSAAFQLLICFKKEAKRETKEITLGGKSKNVNNIIEMFGCEGLK